MKHHLPPITLLLFLLAASTSGFKLKTHVFSANEAMEAITGIPKDAKFGSIGLLADVEIHNPFVVDAVRSFPEYYRAGVLGPDCFPDMVGGQLYVHVDKGSEGQVDVKPDIPFEARTFAQWRSIDYGMYILHEAWAWPNGGVDISVVQKGGGLLTIKTASGGMVEHKALLAASSSALTAAGKNQATKDLERKQKAVAFAYGYLGHMGGDGFAHAFVNTWARGVFSYMKGIGLFEKLTEELKHMAVEGILDHSLAVVPPAKLEIAAPLDFLNHIFTAPVKNLAGGPDLAPAGALAGPYFEKLLQAKRTLTSLSDRNDWPPSLRSKGSFIPNWVKKDIEYFFGLRTSIVDNVLNTWTKMSECIANNLVQGSNLEGNATLENDACFKVDPGGKEDRAGDALMNAATSMLNQNQQDTEQRDTFGGEHLSLKDLLALEKEEAKRAAADETAEGAVGGGTGGPTSSDVLVRGVTKTGDGNTVQVEFEMVLDKYDEALAETTLAGPAPPGVASSTPLMVAKDQLVEAELRRIATKNLDHLVVDLPGNATGRVTASVVSSRLVEEPQMSAHVPLLHKDASKSPAIGATVAAVVCGVLAAGFILAALQYRRRLLRRDKDAKSTPATELTRRTDNNLLGERAVQHSEDFEAGTAFSSKKPARLAHQQSSEITYVKNRMCEFDSDALPGHEEVEVEGDDDDDEDDDEEGGAATGGLASPAASRLAHQESSQIVYHQNRMAEYDSDVHDALEAGEQRGEGGHTTSRLAHQQSSTQRFNNPAWGKSSKISHTHPATTDVGDHDAVLEVETAEVSRVADIDHAEAAEAPDNRGEHVGRRLVLAPPSGLKEPGQFKH